MTSKISILFFYLLLLTFSLQSQKKFSYSIIGSLGGNTNIKANSIQNKEIEYVSRGYLLWGLGSRITYKQLKLHVELGYEKTSINSFLKTYSPSSYFLYSQRSLGEFKRHLNLHGYKLSILKSFSVLQLKKLTLDFETGIICRLTHFKKNIIQESTDTLISSGPGPFSSVSQLSIIANTKFQDNSQEIINTGNTPFSAQAFFALSFGSRNKPIFFDVFFSQSLTPAFVGTYSLKHPSGDARGSFRHMLTAGGVRLRLALPEFPF